MRYQENDYALGTLANLADCAYPDTDDGRAFLTGCVDTAREILDYADDGTPLDRIDDRGAIHEQADATVPVYTAQRWTVFADLAAYRENVTEYGELTDLTDAAGVALYMIAERLITALIEDMWPEDEDEDTSVTV